MWPLRILAGVSSKRLADELGATEELTIYSLDWDNQIVPSSAQLIGETAHLLKLRPMRDATAPADSGTL